jgi:hypothetical protein
MARPEATFALGGALPWPYRLRPSWLGVLGLRGTSNEIVDASLTSPIL